jgi:predicted nucleic acid-binding protein
LIFLDTSFWIALAYEGDAYHQDATELAARHEGDPLATSNHVTGETWTFMRRRYGHRVAVAVLDRMERTPRLTQLWVDREHEAEAWSWLRRHDEREYSFVDATSFALMRSLGIREALAFDGDFAAAGFVELRL